jgi:hypothetical protein
MQPGHVAVGEDFQEPLHRVSASPDRAECSSPQAHAAGGKVTDASEAMKERATFAMCGFAANRQTATRCTCMKAFG